MIIELDKIISQLRAQNPRSKTRKLDKDDLSRALESHNNALASCRADDIEVKTTIVGGYVCNSYGYKGLSDRIEIVSNKDNLFKILAQRSSAQSRAHGNGNCLITRIKKEFQTQGRIFNQ